jgi:cyclase
VREPARAQAICRAFPGRVAIGIDARDGVVKVAGWLEGGATDAATVARAARDWGAAAVVYTDIGRDGTQEGPDLDGTRAVARAAGIPVIASGGVGTLDHLVEGIRDGHATAVLAATIFHFGEYTVRAAKQHMAQAGRPMRLDP